MNNGHFGTGQGFIVIALLVAALAGGVLLAFALRSGGEEGPATASAPLTVLPAGLQQEQREDPIPQANIQPWPAGGTDASQLHDLLYKSPGRVIAQGTNTQPTGSYHLLTYRVEEISLPSNSEFAVNGKLVKGDRAWRVTVTGGPFVVADSPWILWVDSVSLGAGQENPTMTELAFITNDLSQLKEGATLAVSLGEDTKWRETLPETLHFNSPH